MERYKVTHRLSPLNIQSQENELMVNQHIDDLVEIIEDHCIMVCMDLGKSHSKLEQVRSWANLSDQNWEKMIDQLKECKILGTPLMVSERYNREKLVDELLLTWGFKN